MRNPNVQAITGEQPPAALVRGVEGLALGVVVLVSVLSLAGFSIFGLRPERLAMVEGGPRIYGWMLAWAPKAQILLALAALAVSLLLRVRLAWVASFVAVYAISLLSELAGTTVGLPFGAYYYTAGLGAKWFGHVPALIPVSWFLMALPSYALAARRFPSSVSARVLFGSLVLLVWDLSLDPAMSLVTSYWVWGAPGPYYGMPLINLFGWYVTGLALMAAMAWLRTDGWLPKLSLRWLSAFYAANLFLPLGMCLAAGLWGAVAASAAAIIACAWVLAPVTVAGRLPRGAIGASMGSSAGVSS